MKIAVYILALIAVTANAAGLVGTSDIKNGSVTNAKLATMTNSTIKCNVSGGAASPSDCTGAQVGTVVGALIGSKNLSDVSSATTAFTNIKPTDLAYTDIANIFTASNVISVAGASSSPALKINGAPFSGTAVTGTPQVLIGDGPAGTNWGTGSTFLGIQGRPGYAGNIFDFQVNNANVIRANYEGGLVLWNTNDNANYLGSFTACNGVSNPAASANCTSLYESGGGLFKIYSPNAAQGATNMMIFGDSIGNATIGGAAPSSTGWLMAQIANFAAYNAYNTFEVRAKASQTGNLIEAQDVNGAAMAKIDINGNASVQKLKVGTYATHGGVLAYDSVTGYFTGSTVPVPACQAISANNVDWSTGNCFTKTLSANTTLTFSGKAPGQQVTLRIKNAPSNYTLTFPNTATTGASVLWPGSTIPVLTTGQHVDIFTIFFDGTEMYGATPSQNY